MNRPALRKLIQKLAKSIFPADAPLAAPAAIVLHLVDDAAMPAFKAQVFGVAQQTDVIAQRYSVLPGLPETDEGEIIVNAERARREGAHRPGGPAKELALYIAHGLDHLAGHDDATPAERRTMRRRELRWLEESADLLPGLLGAPEAG